MDKNTYIIKQFPNNNSGYSRSRVYNKSHFICYLKEMEVNETVQFRNYRGVFEIKKLKN